VTLINWLLTNLFDILLWPFRSVDPIWALVVVSFLTGLFMLFVFGKVSNQEAIKRVRDRMRGNLLGVRLYQHDVRVVLGLQGEILHDTLIYMAYSVVPMLVLIVPVMLIMVQLNLRFSLRPLQPGHSAVVKVKFKEASQLRKDTHLQTVDAVQVETPGVRIASAKEVAWRIRAERPGHYFLKVRVDSDEVEKGLWVGEGWGTVSALRTGRLGQILLHPGEPPIHPSKAIESVEVQYHPLQLSLLGWNVHWLVLFLILSILFGFAFKRLLGVEV
jgi:uncharacterized membrane protein (DUF106 family)